MNDFHDTIQIRGPARINRVPRRRPRAVVKPSTVATWALAALIALALWVS